MWDYCRSPKGCAVSHITRTDGEHGAWSSLRVARVCMGVAPPRHEGAF